ncbi:MAG: VOC family protein [Sediminicola sp.]
MNVQAYLAFNGDCQEALNFYANCLGGDIVNKQTYQDSKKDIPDSYRDKLQHAELKGSGIHIMAYDAAPDTSLNNGNQIHMSVDLRDPDETKVVFDTLSEGGQVNNPLKKQEWDALYGRCTDKYGIHWMVNCKL